MQCARHGQHELVNRHLERHAVFTHTMIGTSHRTHRGWKWTAAGVFKCFTRRQQRLLTHYPQAANLLGLLQAIGNEPMTADHLGGMLAAIGNAHRIGENKLLLVRPGLVWQVLWCNGNRNIVWFHSRVPDEWIKPCFNRRTGDNLQ